jgi:hypothetical protein
MSRPPSKTSEKRTAAKAPVGPRTAERSRGGGAVDAFLKLQQAAGNRAVTRLLQTDAGRPLAPGTRARMEAQFGRDFSAVRIHAGPEAVGAAGTLSAKAFTVGSHIGFGSGRYAPDTRAGRRLLSHELAHVVQQGRRGSTPPTIDGRGPLESAAQQTAAKAADGGPVAVAGAGAVGAAADPEQEESWLDRAKTGLKRASAAARQAYDDPKAAWQEVKDKARETYGEAKDTYKEYAGKAEGYVTEAKAAWDASPTKKALEAGAKEETFKEKVAKYVEGRLPPASDVSPRAKLLRSASKIMNASAFLDSEPQRAAMKQLVDGHPLGAIKAAQDAAGKGLDAMKEATFDTINKWEDGEFDPESKPMVDPAAHPTLAKVEHGFDVGSKWVGKRMRQVEGGAAKAVFSMVEGIDRALVHPVDTAQGLGKIVNMGSPLPSWDTLKELGGFAKDLVDPKVSGKDALKNLSKAEQDKQLARAELGLGMVKGVLQNYIAAAGGEIVPPVEQQTDEQKERFADKKPGEVSWSGWSKRERIAEIPGLALVDVGSFLVGGGEANAAAKATGKLGAVGKLGEVSKLGELGEFSDASRALGAVEHGAPTAEALAHGGDLGEGAKGLDTAKAGDVKPVETKPVDVKPVEPKPVEPPAGPKPQDAAPQDLKPAETKPTELKAVEPPPAPKPAELKPPEIKAAEGPLKPPETKPLEPPLDIKSARGSRFGPKQRKTLAEAPTGVDTATPLRETPKPKAVEPPAAKPPEPKALEPPPNIKSARGSRFGPKERKALAEAPTGVDAATPLRKAPKPKAVEPAAAKPPEPKAVEPPPDNLYDIKSKEKIKPTERPEPVEAKAEPRPEEIPQEVPAEVPAEVEEAVPEAASAEGRGPRRQAPTNVAGGGTGPKPKPVAVPKPKGPKGRGPTPPAPAPHAAPPAPAAHAPPATPTRAAPSLGGPLADFERQTAGTGGIRSVKKGPNFNSRFSVTIEGEIKDPMFRGKGTPPPGQIKAPDYNLSSSLVSPAEMGLTPADWQQSHLWGPGFGDEAAAGLMTAPTEMNQLFQNRGAEGLIRELYQEVKPAGGRVQVKATATAWDLPTPGGWKPPGFQGEFLKEVEYRVHVELPGGASKDYVISIETKPPPNPGVLRASAKEVIPR